MAKKTIGQLTLNAFGDSITLESTAQPSFFVTLDSAEINQLMEFLLPMASADFNQRQSFRIPLWSSKALKVTLRKDGQEYATNPRNISLAGILVELQSAESDDLPIGTNLQVILNLGDQSQSHEALVCRRQGDRCGLIFPDALVGDEIKPPANYLQLVMDLQRRLVAHREKKE